MRTMRDRTKQKQEKEERKRVTTEWKVPHPKVDDEDSEKTLEVRNKKNSTETEKRRVSRK